MHNPQTRSSYLLAIALALGACDAPSESTPLPPEGDGASGSATIDANEDGESFVRRPRDAGVDATRPPDAMTADAGSTGGGGTAAGIVSCYLQYYPDTTCTLPTHCCFSNYSAAHDGECSNSACSWGTITCDGPEDCASGQYCCAHANIDPNYGTTGYTLACQATACGAAPVNQELCHPTTTTSGTCSGGRACVAARDYDYDLPRSLYICK